MTNIILIVLAIILIIVIIIPVQKKGESEQDRTARVIRRFIYLLTFIIVCGVIIKILIGYGILSLSTDFFR